MPSNEEVLKAEARHDPGVVPKRPIAIERGEGCTLWDADGNAYLDCGASFGAANLGHAHPRLLEALREQSGTLWFAGQNVGNSQRVELLRKLTNLAPGDLDHAFLTNSGTEAVEAALKFARGHTGREGLVACRNGFHGRSLGALSVTGKPPYREPFQPLVPGVSHVAFGDEDALNEAVTEDTAAVVLEPVQGEAGVRVPPPGYLRAAREITEDAGALLIADEVQTGLGRTGRVFAVDHEDVVPDVLCLAKSLAGGFPMGATLLREEVSTLPARSHGSTFGGNPLACAAASAALDVLVEEDLPRRAERLGKRLTRGLTALDHRAVREVRGPGLMVGLELRVRAGPVVGGLARRGVLPLTSGATVLRYLPPLIITEAEVDTVVEATAGALMEAVQ